MKRTQVLDSRILHKWYAGNGKFSFWQMAILAKIMWFDSPNMRPIQGIHRRTGLESDRG